MDGRPIWTDCDEAGDYVVPNVLSPRDLVFRPDNMDETVPHTYKNEKVAARLQLGCCYYAAIKCVCNNWWRQSSQLERLVACLQQPCSFYQRLQAQRATTRSQLQLVAVTSKKTASYLISTLDSHISPRLLYQLSWYDMKTDIIIISIYSIKCPY